MAVDIRCYCCCCCAARRTTEADASCCERKRRGEVEGGERAAQLGCAVHASPAGVKKLHKPTALDSAVVRAACERAPPRENWRSLL